MQLSNQAAGGGFANPRRATDLGCEKLVLVAGTQPEAMARAALALGMSASMVTSGCQI